MWSICSKLKKSPITNNKVVCVSRILLNATIRLMLTLYPCPKVITLCGFHYLIKWKTLNGITINVIHPLLWSEEIWNLPVTRNLPEIYQKFTRNLPEIYQIFTDIIQQMLFASLRSKVIPFNSFYCDTGMEFGIQKNSSRTNRSGKFLDYI
jgi:hypothetical protein